MMQYEKGGLQKEYYARDEVITRVCPFCNSGNCVSLWKERGHLGIVHCNDCGLIYTNPIIKEAQKNYWGNAEKYFQEARLIFSDSAGHHRDPNYLADLKIIEKSKPSGNFLDIGTNMGFFLRHTRNKKWDVYGVEPSPSLSEMARKYFGLNVKTSYLENAGFNDNFFDIVTMTDVFEHIAEPKKILEAIRKVLKNDGILFIKVPNGNYSLLKLWLAKISRKSGSYDIFDSYEHLTHYTEKSLKKMLRAAGFKVSKTYIGKPIHCPVWHKYVGQYYQYPSPWSLDTVNYLLRSIFYFISKIEFLIRFGKIGYFAPNIIIVAHKDGNKTS